MTLGYQAGMKRPVAVVVATGVLSGVVALYRSMWATRRPMEWRSVVDLREPPRAEDVEEVDDNGEAPVLSLVDGRSDPEPLVEGNSEGAPAVLDGHRKTSGS